MLPIAITLLYFAGFGEEKEGAARRQDRVNASVGFHDRARRLIVMMNSGLTRG